MPQGKTQADIDAEEARLRALRRYRTVGVNETTAIVNEMEIQRILNRWRKELIPGGLPTPTLAWLTDATDSTPLMQFSVVPATFLTNDNYVISFYSDVGLTSLVDTIAGTINSTDAADGIVQASLASPLSNGTYYARVIVTRSAVAVSNYSNTVTVTINVVVQDDDDYAAWMAAA